MKADREGSKCAGDQNKTVEPDVIVAVSIPLSLLFEKIVNPFIVRIVIVILSLTKRLCAISFHRIVCTPKQTGQLQSPGAANAKPRLSKQGYTDKTGLSPLLTTSGDIVSA